jgi:hypothetical protein
MSGRLVREPCAPPPALPGRLVLELCRNNGPATESKEVQPKAKSDREATSSFVTRYQQKKKQHILIGAMECNLRTKHGVLLRSVRKAQASENKFSQISSHGRLAREHQRRRNDAKFKIEFVQAI